MLALLKHTTRQVAKPLVFCVIAHDVIDIATAITEHEKYGRVNSHDQHHLVKSWFPRFFDKSHQGITLKEVVWPETTPRSQTTLEKYRDFRRRMSIWWASRTANVSDKLIVGTIGINAAVFLAWRLRPFQPLLTKYFLSSAVPGKIMLSSMILSCFSHISPLHLGLNMYALQSFATQGVAMIGPEQLVGLFLCAGLASSLTSITARLLRSVTTPSVGASGALFGVVGFICTQKPDLPLVIMGIPVSAGDGLKYLMIFDFVGLCLGWRLLDHAAHLGGALYGVLHAYYLREWYLRLKPTYVKGWEAVKESIK